MLKYFAMIQIDQIRISVTEKHKEQRLREKICRLLGVKEAQIEDVSVKKRSIDARKKPQVFYLYTVAVKVAKEDVILQRNKKKPHIGKLQETVYRLPGRKGRPKQRPVVVGFGPAGMFAAYLLALAGAEPIVLERGQAVEQRRRDDAVRRWNSGEGMWNDSLRTESSIRRRMSSLARAVPEPFPMAS